jgi:uncharacterized membrane protein
MLSDGTRKFIITVVLLILVDIPWLTFSASAQQSAIRDIQGGKAPYFRLTAAIPVYLALAYLVLRVKTPKEAFLTGLAVYAVYDFTVYTIFDRYPIWIAVADAIWGGVLFVVVYHLLKYLK